MRNFLDASEINNRDAKKQLFLKQIINSLLQEHEQTIPDICHQFKWSIPTGTKLVQELVKKKILVKKGKRDSGGGRRPDVFSLNASMGYVIGIELLVQSFKLTIVNLHHEIVYEYEDTSFDIRQDDEALEFLKGIVPSVIRKQKINKEKILGVGIGITGRVNKLNGASYTYLNFDKPLPDILKEEWQLPVYTANDTQLMALGEKNFGHAKGKHNVVIVNVSRGIAVGIITDDNIHYGRSGFAGEFGHIHVSNNNRLCICGKKGCLETVVSGIALENDYNTEDAIAGKLKTKKYLYKEILQLAKKGDSKAELIISKMGEDLGQAVSILIHLLNPELVIIGGSFTTIGEKMIYPIARGMNLYGLPQLVADCDLKISSLGERATMLGAFSLVFEKEFQ
ncbi:ROK family protein [Chitinophagaceae bacterium LWZ2-11]